LSSATTRSSTSSIDLCHIQHQQCSSSPITSSLLKSYTSTKPGLFSCNNNHHGHFFFSSSSSSTSSDTGSIKITKTASSSSPPPPPSSSNEQEQQEEEEEPQKAGSSQQEQEEELSALMSETKQHYQHANYTEALSTSVEFLTQSTTLFGNRHPAVASAHNNVGLMNKMLGNYDAARQSYHSALQIYGEVVGKDHASYAATLHNLGILDKTQSTMDDSLKTVERMGLLDTAVEYFESALEVRENELGKEHVHTVTTRSNLGGAIAAQVVQSEILRQKRWKEKLGLAETKEEEEGKENIDSSSIQMTNEEKVVKGQRVIEQIQSVSKFTQAKWEMAEKHLRDALRTAIDNPRGEAVSIPSISNTNNKNKAKKGGTARQRKMAQKLQQEQEQNKEIDLGSTHTSSTGTSTNNSDSFEEIWGLGDTSIRTLSSAAAAQNLAVFLKTRADLISNTNMILSKTKTTTKSPLKSLDSGDMYAEAKKLYIGALRVRTELKGDVHPDTVSTKFSLSELIDTLGDEQGANKLRQELLDAYQVEERGDVDASRR